MTKKILAAFCTLLLAGVLPMFGQVVAQLCHLPQVDTPSFSPDGGTAASFSVSMSDGTGGATIIYCSSVGSNCNPVGGTTFSVAVSVTVDQTHLCAYAIHTQMADSATHCATYTVAVVTTYFGGVSDTSTGAPIGTSTDTLSNYEMALDPASTYATCPGTGTKTVVSMAAQVLISSGTGDIRILMYDSASPHNFVAQSPTISFTNTSLAWVEATSGFLNQALSPITPTCTGGDKYLLLLTSSGSGISFGENAGVAGTTNLYRTPATLYAGGPTTVDTSTGWTSMGGEMPDIRIGVQ